MSVLVRAVPALLSCLGATLVSGGAALAQEAGWGEMSRALQAATGSVDVVIAGALSSESLGGLLDLLAQSSADQVRISMTYDVPGRRELGAVAEAVARERGLPWHVCHDWWLIPDHDWRAAFVHDELGGSLVLIDNDPSSGVVENPEEDLAVAIQQDPAFAGVLGAAPRRIEEADVYFEAVSAPWSQVQGHATSPAQQEQGGWVDGC